MGGGSVRRRQKDGKKIYRFHEAGGPGEGKSPTGFFIFFPVKKKLFSREKFARASKDCTSAFQSTVSTEMKKNFPLVSIFLLAGPSARQGPKAPFKKSFKTRFKFQGAGEMVLRNFFLQDDSQRFRVRPWNMDGIVGQ